MTMTARAVCFGVLCALVALSGVSADANTCIHRVKNCDPARDYFDTKLQFEHAGSVDTMTFHNTYIDLELKWTAWSGQHEERLILVRCGCPAPAIADANAKIIHVPVATAFFEETVVVPRIHLIGQRSKLVAVASARYITTPAILDDIANEVVLDIGNNYTRLHELDALPDVLITGSGSNAWRTGWTAEMSSRQILDADAGETTPLGRAELVKLMGYIFGAEDAAKALFELIELRYNSAKERATTSRKRPTVMLGLPFKGWGWSQAAGSTYVGRFLADANVEYKNADDSLGRSAMTVGTILDNFRESHFWINAYYSQPDQSDMTMDEMVAGNVTEYPGGDREVFPQFRAFKCNNVFSNDAKVEPPLQGNPYWEEGALRPDLILSDLVTIFHGEEKDHAGLSFYRRLRPLTDASGVGSCNLVDLPDVPAASYSYFWAKFAIRNMHQLRFLDRVVDIKATLATALKLTDDRFEVFVSNDPAPSPDGTFWVLEVNVDSQQCGNCGDDGPEVLDAACIDMSQRLADLEDTLATSLQEVESSATVSTVKPVHVVCSTGDAVAVSALMAATGDSDDGLSTTAIVGIAIGAGVALLLIVVAAGVSFRAGKGHAYKIMDAPTGSTNVDFDM